MVRDKWSMWFAALIFFCHVILMICVIYSFVHLKNFFLFFLNFGATLMIYVICSSAIFCCHWFMLFVWITFLFFLNFSLRKIIYVICCSKIFDCHVIHVICVIYSFVLFKCWSDSEHDLTFEFRFLMWFMRFKVGWRYW